jgi:hypothetical protein
MHMHQSHGLVGLVNVGIVAQLRKRLPIPPIVGLVTVSSDAKIYAHASIPRIGGIGVCRHCCSTA